MIDHYDLDDTIVAQATAAEPGYPRGILRLSGPRSMQILSRCFQASDGKKLDESRETRQVTGTFSCDEFPVGIPARLLLWPTEKSYTRQASAEVHAPGSLPLLDAIIQQLTLHGARMAKPGEFTLRAFLGGRLDLTEAEAVLGVIDAADQKHLNVALKQLSGGLSRPLQQSRQDLLMMLASLEAGLDFVEEDIEFVSVEQVLQQLDRCLSDLEQLQNQLVKRDQAERGIRVVLFGRPNVGKSSLFNLLVSRFGRFSKAAIVSDVSGTTRDFISAQIFIQGIELELIDTAGIETGQLPRVIPDDNSNTPISIGQNQAIQQQNVSDITLFCLDSSKAHRAEEINWLVQPNRQRIVCLNKSDLSITDETVRDQHNVIDGLGENPRPIRLSAHSGEGIDELAVRILELVNRENAESMPSTGLRCKAAIEDAMQALRTARVLAIQTAGDELIAGEIRVALEAIGRITGTVYTDDILDVVFRQFCIGK